MSTVIIDPTSPQWQLSSTGAWAVRGDRRGVLRMRHPYQPSTAGDFASARISVPIFSAPIRRLLRFYQTDDYVGCANAHAEIGYSAEDFPGCRAARVLVGGTEVWRRDVHGRCLQPFHEVEFSEPGGSTFEVEFRVEDLATVEQPFATEVFWALPRIELLAVDEEPPEWGPGTVPSARLTVPGAAAAEAVPLRSVPLVVENAAGVDRADEPVLSGVPIPRGELLAPAQARLQDADGTEVPCQFSSLASWPDGSVKALQVAFTGGPVAAEDRRCFSLQYGTDVAPAAAAEPIARHEAGGTLVVDTGSLRATIGSASGSIIQSLAIPGHGGIEFTHPLLSLESYDGFPPRLYRSLPPEAIEVEDNGPVYACVLARGRYEALGQEGFSYELRLGFSKGSAEFRIQHTVINTSEAPSTRLRTISLHLPVQATGFAVGDPESHRGSFDGLCEVRLVQDHHDRCRLYHIHGDSLFHLTPADVRLVARGGRSEGWAAAIGAVSLLVANRYFWQQFPKALRIRPDEVQVDLFTCERVPYVLGSDAPFECKQGEAKSHELLVTMLPSSAEEDVLLQARRLSTRADQPLFARATPNWYCKSGVFGPIAPAGAGSYPSYEAGIAARPIERLGHGGGDWWHRVVEDGEEDPESFMLYGMEDFGDNPLIWGYQTKYCKWANCEYDLGHALILQFARSGDLRYLRRGEQSVLHNRDVDVIHHDTTHPEDVGGPHGHWIHHTDQRPNTGHLWSEGMVEHYLLTGDRRSLQVAREMGRYLVRVAGRGWGGGSERSAGWPLIALTGIYAGTGEMRYLKAAEQIVRDAVRLQDPVRGVWSSPIYEQPAYEGGTTFMTHILCRGLLRYVEATGDSAAAQAIVRAAWWLAEEAITEEDEHGPRAFYKQTPLCARTSPADPEALAYAYALSGDQRLGALARAAAKARACDWREAGVPLAQMRDLPRVLAVLGPESDW